MRSAIFFLTILILLPGQSVFSQPPAGRSALLQKLIDLPAPAPFDPFKESPVNSGPERAPREDDDIPPDDAPIGDLLAFWSFSYNGLYTARYIPTPSKKTVERILEYCEENPVVMPNYLAMLPSTPETVDAVRRIHDKMVNDADSGPSNTVSVKGWLKFHSRLHIQDLVNDANRIKDEAGYTSLENQYALRALAEIDWDMAEPIVRRLENDPSNPASAVLANWVTYRHAMDTGDFSTASSYREKLQAVVADKKANFKIRDLAMDALTHSPPWEGRDEWYVSLLEDETLLAIEDEGWTGLSTMVMESPRKEWIGRMIELTESANITVRSAAVRNLMRVVRKGDANILKALVPWLTDPNWTKISRSGLRSNYIYNLGQTVVPEAVPGLIFIVINDPEMRGVSVSALAMQKDPRANPALRMVLADEETAIDRVILINALLSCGGFPDDEQMAALESYVLLMATGEGRRQIESYYDAAETRHYGGVGKPLPDRPTLPLQVFTGLVIGDNEWPSEGLVARAIERLKILKRTNPPAAAVLSELMLKWKGPGIFAERLRQVGAGESDINGLIILLATRKEIREALPVAVPAMRGSKGMARGIGSCIAEDPVEYDSILRQKDTEAQVAMLGCARLVRAALPLPQTGTLLDSADKLLALAAERYLESEDSLEARKLVLNKKKGAAVVLGARAAFFPDAKPAYNVKALTELFKSVSSSDSRPEDFPALNKKEEELRRELAASPSIKNIYALLVNGPAGHSVVRLYGDRAVFTHYEDEARYRQRDLTKKEYDGFIGLLTSENIDAQKPAFTEEYEQRVPGEFVMFGRDGGRRVFFESTGRNPSLVKLRDVFEGLRQVEGKLHYYLADKMPGFEVLLADSKLPVRAVWKKGNDLRFVAEDLGRAEELRNERAAGQGSQKDPGTGESPDDSDAETRYAHVSWRTLVNGKPGSIVAQPADVPLLPDNTRAPDIPGILTPPRGWQVRSGGGEIRAGGYYKQGLFRITPGQEPVKLKDGLYSDPIVTADGRWIFAVKIDTANSTQRIVRVSLQTGRELPVDMPAAGSVRTLAFIHSHNKVLAVSGAESDDHEDPDDPDEDENALPEQESAGPVPAPKPPEYYLVDAATGAVQKIRGDVRPLLQQTYRPLQPTDVAGEFWAAIYDENTKTTSVGRYSDRTFTFRTVLNVPGIEFDSMAVWVDEPGGKVYFVYQGHLLSLPLK